MFMLGSWQQVQRSEQRENGQVLQLQPVAAGTIMFAFEIHAAS